MFAVFEVAAAITTAALIHTDRARLWQAAGLVALGPIGGYLLTRSNAVLFDRVDVGNCGQPSGLVALFIEASALALCCYTLRRAPSTQAGNTVAWWPLGLVLCGAPVHARHLGAERLRPLDSSREIPLHVGGGYSLGSGHAQSGY